MTTVVRLHDLTLPETGLPPISSFSAPQLPITAGLLGLYTLGGDYEASCRNHAVPSSPLTVRGSPEAVNVGMEITREGFNVGFQIPDDITAFFVAPVETPASVPDGQALLTTYQNGAPVAGDTFAFTYSAGSPRFALYVSDSGGSARVRASIVTDDDLIAGQLALFVGRIKANGQCKVWAYQREVMLSSDETDPLARNISDRELSIGNRYGSGANFGGTAMLNLLAIYGAALTDAEVTDACNAIRDHYGRIGMPI